MFVSVNAEACQCGVKDELNSGQNSILKGGGKRDSDFI